MVSFFIHRNPHPSASAAPSSSELSWIVVRSPVVWLTALPAAIAIERENRFVVKGHISLTRSPPCLLQSKNRRTNEQWVGPIQHGEFLRITSIVYFHEDDCLAVNSSPPHFKRIKELWRKQFGWMPELVPTIEEVFARWLKWSPIHFWLLGRNVCPCQCDEQRQHRPLDDPQPFHNPVPLIPSCPHLQFHRCGGGKTVIGAGAITGCPLGLLVYVKPQDTANGGF